MESSDPAGKWPVTRHLPPEGPKHNWPLQRGFDRYFGTITGAGSYFEPDTLVRANTPIEAGSGFYSADEIAGNAAGFMHAHLKTRPGQPFFLYCAFTAPHWPLRAPEADIVRCRGRFDKGWDLLRRERHECMIAMGVVDKRWQLSPRDPQAPAWTDAANRDWQLRRMEVYATQVEILACGLKGNWELYDMEANRTELNDLASQNPTRVANLAVMWGAWATRVIVLPHPIK